MAFGTLLLISGCGKKGPPSILIEIPDNFAGRIRIHEDRSKAAKGHADGETVVSVDEEGRADVQTVDIFDAWHVERVVETGGHVVPVATALERLRSDLDGRYAYCVGASSSRTAEYLVGTGRSILRLLGT